MALARVRGPGHPDLVCDLVAATLAEEYLTRDPHASLDLRVMGGRGVLFVAGELGTQADFDVSSLVKRVVAESGVLEDVEPFVALEPMLPSWALEQRTREVWPAFGYATKETPEDLPRVVTMARSIARVLEYERVTNPDWFWLGSDYEVWVEQAKQLTVTLRLPHVESLPLAAMKERILAFLSPQFPGMPFLINTAGEEFRAGLGVRLGASARESSLDQYGTLLPATASGVGRHLSHPANAGAWLARSLARELVHKGYGQSVTVRAWWHPLETRPSHVVIRNEQGALLTGKADLGRLDLEHLPVAWQRPILLRDAIRTSYARSITLPWEANL